MARDDRWPLAVADPCNSARERAADPHCAVQYVGSLSTYACLTSTEIPRLRTFFFFSFFLFQCNSQKSPPPPPPFALYSGASPSSSTRFWELHNATLHRRLTRVSNHSVFNAPCGEIKQTLCFFSLSISKEIYVSITTRCRRKIIYTFCQWKSVANILCKNSRRLKNIKLF